MPNELVIEELTGPRRERLTFSAAARTLPEDLPVSGEQRTEVTHYPGNPEASVQVLGPKTNDVKFSGRLDDRYMLPAATAMDVMSAIEAIRDRGLLCELHWGELFFRGLLREAEFKVRHRALVEYTITFAAIGTMEQPPRAPATLVTLQLSPKIDKALDQLLSAQLSTYAQRFSNVLQDVQSAINTVVKRVNDVKAAFNQVGSVLQDAASTIARLTGTLRALKGSAAVVVNAIEQVRASLKSSARDAQTIVQLQTFIYDARRGARTIVFETQKQVDDIERSRGAKDNSTTHVVKGGETLQSISNRYFSTSSKWQQLATANSLATTDLRPGQVLIIPNRGGA